MHPTGRQIFAGKSDSIFYNIQDLAIVVVEVTMNMAEYGSRRPPNVKFELIIKGLKSDIFD